MTMQVRTHSNVTHIDFLPIAELQERLPSKAVIVTDDIVTELWESPHRRIVVPAGEASKSLHFYSQVVEQILSLGIDRNTIIVALGGGVVGDLAGFVAATILRGVTFLQVPTTLLAMVDSSIGGKVGVDTPQGKNLVGAFKPADQVLICPEFLDQLPARQLTNGMAEVWKYGFIGDAPELTKLRGGQAPLTEIIFDCLDHKARVVEEDEFETSGLRATLNFGHTVGHAIEKVLRYETFLHGEAISIGMVAEARLGELLGITEAGTAEQVKQDLASAGLPVHWDGLRDFEPLIAAMRSDKKATGGKLAFSLLTRLGDCKLVRDVDDESVQAALTA
jgi:3-dehydroquinate synthase